MEPGPALRVAERLRDLGDVERLDVVEPAGGLERPTEELSRLEVRVDGLGALAGDAGVAPGLVEPVRVQEVEREELRLLVRRGPGDALDRLADACVQLEPAAVRQSLVGGVADEGVAEVDRSKAIDVDETGQALPDPVVEVVAARVEGRGEDLRREAGAEDGSGAQYGSVARAEAVYLVGQQGLQGVW